jgi:hypothetical protein
MTAKFGIQRSEKYLALQMPFGLDPLLYPSTRSLQSVAHCSALYTWLSLPVFCPKELKSQEGKPTLHARMKAAKSQDACLCFCQLQFEFRQPFG